MRRCSYSILCNSAKIKTQQHTFPNGHLISYRDFQIEISPSIILRLLAHTCEPESGSVMDARRHSNSKQALLKAPGDIHQLAGAQLGLPWRNGYRSVKMRVGCRSFRAYNLQARSLLLGSLPAHQMGDSCFRNP